jgi:hypothetical protein
VILWRVLAPQRGAAARDAGGPLFFPRPFQGHGRHDNPARYGCLYLSTAPVSSAVEALARFRGAEELREEMLVRDGRGLVLAGLELPDALELVDLDDPPVLARERMRPSAVATHARANTQAYAERIYDAHPDAAGLRWWSTFESSWINVTLFDRAGRRLRLRTAEPLTLGHSAVLEAAEFLGFA